MNPPYGKQKPRTGMGRALRLDLFNKSCPAMRSDGFCVALSRRCLLVRRSLGETLFKGVDGHLEIIAPLDQGPC